jgi:hypothetical protein
MVPYNTHYKHLIVEVDITSLQLVPTFHMCVCK